MPAKACSLSLQASRRVCGCPEARSSGSEHHKLILITNSSPSTVFWGSWQLIRIRISTQWTPQYCAVTTRSVQESNPLTVAVVSTSHVRLISRGGGGGLEIQRSLILFLVTFEEIILAILPTACFIIVTPFRTLHLFRGKLRVRKNALQLFKLVCDLADLFNVTALRSNHA